MAFEEEILNQRIDAKRDEIQAAMDSYLSRHLFNANNDGRLIGNEIAQFSLLTECSVDYYGVWVNIHFVKELDRQIWIGSTEVGKGIWSRREHCYGFIELKRAFVNSSRPIDVRLVCGWPPFYMLFLGLASHISRYFKISVYREGFSAEGEKIDQILRCVTSMQESIFDSLSIVKSLRMWAISIEKRGIPLQKDIQDAIVQLSTEPKDFGGAYGYLEACLPLIPGLLSYKVELGKQAQIDLQNLWHEISTGLASA